MTPNWPESRKRKRKNSARSPVEHESNEFSSVCCYFLFSPRAIVFWVFPITSIITNLIIIIISVLSHAEVRILFFHPRSSPVHFVCVCVFFSSRLQIKYPSICVLIRGRRTWWQHNSEQFFFSVSFFSFCFVLFESIQYVIQFNVHLDARSGQGISKWKFFFSFFQCAQQTMQPNSGQTRSFVSKRACIKNYTLETASKRQRHLLTTRALFLWHSLDLSCSFFS